MVTKYLKDRCPAVKEGHELRASEVVNMPQAAQADVATANAGAITTADADATYGQPEADLINELKTDYNAAVTLINELKTVQNALLAKLRTAGVIST